MKIAELQVQTGKNDVEGVITEKQEPRTFEKFGKAGKVANAKLKDDSGEVTITLWNEQVDQVKVGDKIKITNGWVGEWQGDKQLSTGKFGALEVVTGSAPAGDAAPSGDAAEKPAETSTPDSGAEEESMEGSYKGQEKGV